MTNNNSQIKLDIYLPADKNLTTVEQLLSRYGLIICTGLIDNYANILLQINNQEKAEQLKIILTEYPGIQVFSYPHSQEEKIALYDYLFNIDIQQLIDCLVAVTTAEQLQSIIDNNPDDAVNLAWQIIPVEHQNRLNILSEQLILED